MIRPKRFVQAACRSSTIRCVDPRLPPLLSPRDHPLCRLPRCAQAGRPQSLRPTTLRSRNGCVVLQVDGYERSRGESCPDPWDQGSQGMSNDSQEDSQIGGRSWTAADSRGILTLRFQPGRTPMDRDGRRTRGLQNRGECERLARVFYQGTADSPVVACSTSCSNSAED